MVIFTRPKGNGWPPPIFIACDFSIPFLPNHSQISKEEMIVAPVLRDLLCIAHVVEVAVGHEDEVGFHPVGADRGDRRLVEEWIEQYLTPADDDRPRVVPQPGQFARHVILLARTGFSSTAHLRDTAKVYAPSLVRRV